MKSEHRGDRPDPSDILVRLCALLFDMERDVHRNAAFGQWCDVVCPEVAAANPGRTFEMPLRELWRMRELDGIEEWMGDVPTTLESFWKLAKAVAVLDCWHMPLTTLGSQGAWLRDSHRVAQRRFVNFGRFNDEFEGGLLIPARVLADMAVRHYAHRGLLEKLLKREPLDDTGTGRARTPLLAALLSHTSFLPAQLERMDVDESTESSADTINLSYSRYRAGAGVGSLIRGDPPRVMVAAMAEARGDVVPLVPRSLDRYGMKPTYPKERIGQVLTAAVDGEVHLLFLPEMTLDEDDVPQFVDTLQACRETFLDARGQPPPLSYIFLGISAGPSETGVGRNYLLLLDADGVELLRQDKLYRWNLDSQAQQRFDFAPEFPGAADELKENIEPGRSIGLIDLEDVGRVATLICADVSANMPGDWLIGHAGIDWLHAPIMDQSTCWERDDRGPLGIWITRRAVRAALVSEARVVVTNSMTLTHRVNASNARRALNTRYKAFEKCGIALLLDASQPEPSYEHILVPLDADSPVTGIRDWNRDWCDLREILSKSAPASSSAV